MLTPDEAKALLVLLSRAQINFNEAEIVVTLKNKLNEIVNSKEETE